ncbi:hypothetical protein A3A21_00360 [Candidatus Jorgensenbacteria bacterium RIFCSPLOWO2_01_FULL_45_25b]|uniref:Small ribosomal subunit protein bS6 n=1 Tax=Candidatus Jorgensenbacteria bacterium RIFCSPLOWO2_01_FULL_45_25b TaxID=1798471 RepID=A0A1F6BUQ6_9BACT|nr:MAG: hypothetical protein A3A21_00360 [Candidatus Jorgensenbacteria bacterium RIFCSPLOWO2_01_FULL_45_25b]
MTTENYQEEEHPLYEITYLLKDEADLPLFHACFTKFHASHLEDASLTKVRLEYMIKKASQGFLGVSTFRIDPSALADFSRDLRLISEVLRFIILKPTLRSIRVARKEGERRPPSQRREVKVAAPEFRGGGAELTNEALEKKIEEILQ